MPKPRALDLTKDAMEELVEKFTRKEIAEQLSCSEKTVSRFCKEHDITFDRVSRDQGELANWYNSLTSFPDSLSELAEQSPTSYEKLRKFLDRQKVKDLKIAADVMQWIKDNPDHKWANRGHIFKTRNITKFKLLHNRINRELRIFLTLHDGAKVIKLFKDVNEFKSQFPID